CSRTKTVAAGDLCYTIALQFGLSLQQLAAMNPSLSCSNLQIGQVICVVGGCQNSYSVVAGDYCYSIAQKQGISVAQLQNANPGLNCASLQIGAVLITIFECKCDHNSPPRLILVGTLLA
ncbi:hypothetical protein M427DRAFT_105803, partial [Gonapodya prolifera JEL478]